jgi:hypothetical protein
MIVTNDRSYFFLYRHLTKYNAKLKRRSEQQTDIHLAEYFARFGILASCGDDRIIWMHISFADLYST